MSKRKREELKLGKNEERKRLKTHKQNEDGIGLNGNPEAATHQPINGAAVVATISNDQNETEPTRKIVSKKKKKKKKQKAEQEFNAEITVDNKPENVAEQPKESNGQVSAEKEDKITAKHARRLAKREKRKKAKEQIYHAQSLEQGDVGKHEKLPFDQRRKHKAHRYKVENDSLMGTSSWSFSDVIGGQMLDMDPVFALNEEYLLVAYDTAVNVYSTSTSLLVRRLRVNISDRVAGFALSFLESNQLFLATESGLIEKWDWIEGQRLEYWNVSTPIQHITTSKPNVEEESSDLVYTVDRKGGSQWMLTAHRLLGGEEASKTDLGTLIKYPQPLTSVSVLEKGRIIVLTSNSRLIIGSTDKPDSASLNELAYVWRDIECPEWITSIDVQIRPKDKDAKKPKDSECGNLGAVNVVVGILTGAIIRYDDLLRNLIVKERQIKSENATGVSSQRLHWHRNAVLALKWSKDGNYIISGGSETVLILWQLDTGEKQVLPHLSASIESIVVSPSGSGYSIRLADNSAMILSTSDLQPTFSVSGIQIPAIRKSAAPLPFIPTVDAPSQDSVAKPNLRFPAVVSPSGSSSLLLAVPSSTASRAALTARNPACYLQTFDVGSVQQIAQQALTRTKATILNMGPESNTIEEPNVIYMQISHDGQWLATIDEWLPPRRDVAFLAWDKEKEVEEQSARREVYLKIWLWNDLGKMWELVSRIDDPHASPSSTACDANIVLGLASDPSGAAFATVGNDFTVRIWKPSARRRHRREVRDQQGQSLSNWNCHRVVSLEQPFFFDFRSQKAAMLAYSQDGSVLATGYQQSSPSTIYLIDPRPGVVQRTITGLYTGPLFGLGILNQLLILLSNEVCTWDLVTEEHGFVYALPSHGLSHEKLSTGTHLAVDSRHETFAISLIDIGKSSKGETKLKSQIIIFDPKNPRPLFDGSASNIVTALLPITARKGYYVIDAAAEVRILSPIFSVFPVSSQSLASIESSPRGLENIYGNGIIRSTMAESSDDENLSGGELLTAGLAPVVEKEDAVVVSPDKLAELFDTGSAFTLPPMTELFEQVARLFTNKPI